ncbi:hypothetical protein E2C01_064068 [Portunus trituberculatus]|uniref:Uncharacterized protein n=1 Tax=Portunus trituberculatus TaxID=210409 RepID=A0A5B7HKR3_PORTR|nr:hypothetical protein [Portunus trituberculatus]
MLALAKSVKEEDYNPEEEGEVGEDFDITGMLEMMPPPQPPETAENFLVGDDMRALKLIYRLSKKRTRRKKQKTGHASSVQKGDCDSTAQNLLPDSSIFYSSSSCLGLLCSREFMLWD